MYPRMAKEAREEGFNDLAVMFEGIAKVEAEHEKRYRELAKNVEDGTVFAKGGKLFWKCRNCGAVFELDKAPREVPRLPAPAGLLRNPGEELVNGFFI